MKSLLETQIGGTHYKGMVFQPFEIGHANQYDAETFSIMKYVMRHAEKGGKIDLQKAIHICDIRSDLTEKWGTGREAVTRIAPSEFNTANGVPAPEAAILFALHWVACGQSDFTISEVKAGIEALIDIRYPEGTSA